jgi:hypothetical protein
MTCELSKTISTCAIWLATAVILTFGVFRMNGDMVFFWITTAMIAGIAYAATRVVWNPTHQTVATPAAEPRRD